MDWIALADAFVALMQWLGLAFLGAGAAISLREGIVARAPAGSRYGAGSPSRPPVC
jgi:hypothetical protein